MEKSEYKVGQRVKLIKCDKGSCWKIGETYFVSSRERWDKYWPAHKLDYDSPTHIALHENKDDTPYICPLSWIIPNKITSWKNKIGGSK